MEALASDSFLPSFLPRGIEETPCQAQTKGHQYGSQGASLGKAQILEAAVQTLEVSLHFEPPLGGGGPSSYGSVGQALKSLP